MYKIWAPEVLQLKEVENQFPMIMNLIKIHAASATVSDSLVRSGKVNYCFGSL